MLFLFSLSAFRFIQCKLTSISAILACFCGDWSQLKTQYSAILLTLLAASQVQSPCCSGMAVCVQKWHFFGFFILKITCRHHGAHKMSGIGDSNTSECTALVSFAPCLNSSMITRLNTVSSCLASWVCVYACVCMCVCVCLCVCVCVHRQNGIVTYRKLFWHRQFHCRFTVYYAGVYV